MPPDVALDVTVALEPIEPELTTYLYCNAVPTSASVAVISIETGVPSVKNVYEAFPADVILGVVLVISAILYQPLDFAIYKKLFAVTKACCPSVGFVGKRSVVA